MAEFAPGSTRARGHAIEQAVASFLERRGLEVIERNVEVGGGEIDLVARLRDEDGEQTIVFVEVRSRAHAGLGTPAETVSRQKRAHLIRAASAWLVARNLWERVAVRFDVVGVIVQPHFRLEIEWIPNAFDTDG